MNKREKRSTSRHRRWSVVPNESSRDFGPCDRFWTQLALIVILLFTLLYRFFDARITAIFYDKNMFRNPKFKLTAHTRPTPKYLARNHFLWPRFRLRASLVLFKLPHPVSRGSITCRSLRLRQIIDLLATDKLRYFSQPRSIIVKCFPFFDIVCWQYLNISILLFHREYMVILPQPTELSEYKK